MGMLVFVSLFAQAHRDFLSNHWYFRRVVLYSAFIFASVVPVMHWIVLSGGFQDPFVRVSWCWCERDLPLWMTSLFLQLFISKIFVMYVITVIGGLFYVSQFPEKMFPGILGMVLLSALVIDAVM